MCSDLNGGSPKSSGWKSVSDLRTNVAGFLNSASTWSAGTMTTCIPALIAAIIPLGESSNTRH